MKKPNIQKELLSSKPKRKSWKQKQKRKQARAKDSHANGESLHGSKFFKPFKGSWNSKKVRKYLIYDESKDRYICNVGLAVGPNLPTFLKGNKQNYSTGPKSRAFPFSVPHNFGSLTINFIIGDIKHTGAWRTIRIK